MDKGNMIFETESEQGFVFKAWKIKDSKLAALVEVEKDGGLIRSFLFPAYKVWNVPAHSRDIIESELAGNFDGYWLAGATGFGESVFM